MDLSQILQTLINLMQSLGYFGLFLLMILENVFPPIPSEAILPTAGMAAAQGKMNLALVVLVGALGSVVGTLPLYYLGRALALERILALTRQYGKWLALSEKDIQKAVAWFQHYGPKAVLFGRMVPGVRSLLSIPAGISAMPLLQFMFYSFIGSGLWSALLAGVGYVLGENAEQLTRYLDPLGKFIAIGLVVAFVAWVLKRKSAPVTSESEAERQS